LALSYRILYREGTTEEEMSTEDRRAPGATRIPFDGLVEVGGAMGPAFEAQAVNLSEEGMLLRTAYLPEAGQPLTCRFDAGPGHSVLASGEVVWAQGADKGGEFAIRFTDMDPESVDALKRACGIGEPASPAALPGGKVRLHIEGLASPMKAKIKGSHAAEITVGSDLGFLQVGRQLELEDAQSGNKRPANIDRVEVAVDPTSNVPQLVVTLRYSDAQGDADGARSPAPAPKRKTEPMESRPADASAADDESVDEASIRMKGAVARNIARLGPALDRFTKRAKTTIALLAARRSLRDDDAAAPRRTTAPAPGGGLHTSGRRVVRGEVDAPGDDAIPKNKLALTRRRAAVGGGVMIAAILGALAIKSTHHEAAPELASATAQGASTPAAAPVPAAPPPAAAPVPPIDTGTAMGGQSAPIGGLADADDPMEGNSTHGHKHHGHVTPFGNGPVHHGNVLHLKMDGPIEAIEGAQQPTGFAVKLPGRKSLEAAGPLASRDARIAAIKVSNDPAGAELTVAFKDGVPNYNVSAKGDTLTIMLSPVGGVEKVAKKDASGAHAGHHKHNHKKAENH
jgi:PilZ domain